MASQRPFDFLGFLSMCTRRVPKLYPHTLRDLIIAPLICRVFVGLGFVLFWTNSVSETRLALVIHNSNYTHELTLPGATRDGQLVARSLEGIGFHVFEHADVGSGAEFRRIIDQFLSEIASQGNVNAFFYYAGHGVSASRRGGALFLYPTQFDPRGSDDPRDLVTDGEILDRLSLSGARIAIAVFDACRTILRLPPPVERSIEDYAVPEADGPIESNRTDTWFARQRGLQNVGGINGPRTQMFVAYSTEPGNVASDDSPFASSLGAAIQQPGATPQDAFAEARRQVVAASESRQVPFIEDGLYERFRFVPTWEDSVRSLEELISQTYWGSAEARQRAIPRLADLISNTPVSTLRRIHCDRSTPIVVRHEIQRQGVSCED